MDGVEVTLINGFPNATTANGIGKALQSLSGYKASGGGTGAGDTLTFTTNPAPSSTNDCNVIYSAPVNSSKSAVTTIDTDDCG
jgi:hypothetical protein